MPHGAFYNALDALAALTVSGVTQYGIQHTPEALTRAHLPALLVLPGDTQDDRLFRERGAGFHQIAFSGGVHTLSVTVTHLLLVAPVLAAEGARAHIPALIDHVDNYFSALGATPTLNGLLASPAQIVVELGTFPYSAVNYHGCAFRHTWVLEG
jgi:hypothetical protein